MSFPRGDTLTLSINILVAGEETDPTVLTLSLYNPIDRSVTTYTYGVGDVIVKDSEGNYHATLAFTASGRWAYRWQGTAPAPGVAEGTIEIEGSRF